MPDILIKLTLTLLAAVIAVGLFFVNEGFNDASRLQVFLWRQMSPFRKKFFFTNDSGTLRKGTKYFIWAVLLIFLALLWFDII
jgi:hypothetical protein